VRSLILYAPFAAPLNELGDLWAKTPQEWFELLSAIRRDWGTGANAAIYAPSADAELRDWYGRLERLTGSPRTRELLTRTVGRVDVRALLPTIHVPTLVLRRAGDTLVPGAMARYVADAIPGSRLVEVPGEDHLTIAGDPEPILSEVEHFLTGRRRAAEPDRALATVLFTDIVDSTALAGELGDRAWLSLLKRHDELVRGSLSSYGGDEVKHTGDGFMASFDGPARGVRCAATIADQVADLGLSIRAGLHTGECTRVGASLEGIAVHLGARVAQEATGGEVLVTRTVKDLVIGSDLEFEPRGEHELKGFPGRWELFQVV
jgi:class 3 adenylate cyclase